MAQNIFHENPLMLLILPAYQNNVDYDDSENTI